MTVRSLEHVRRTDLDQAGGKAANLGELLAHGFPIPSGFVVCADHYRDALSRIDPSDDAEVIRRRLITNALADDLHRDILAAHAQIQAARDRPVIYAVRSSATAEDLGDASFAGQHDTYYYVTEDTLSAMIRKCWASLWSDAAVSYRASRGIEHAGVMMAVLVQDMIPSDVSGVTFTANPVSGDTSEIVTDATWGMGAAIVDGRVSPDHYVVDRANLTVVEKRIANKKFMVSAELPDAEQRMSDVPFDRRQTSSLTDDMLLEATRWGIRAADYFGCPQDVEWAVHDSRYFMLQSRPITIMGEEAFAPGEKRKLVLFKPAAENFTDPLLPLSRDVLPPGPHWIKGRPYSALAPIRLLLPIKLTDLQAAQLAYFELPDDLDIEINWWKLPITALTWFFIYLCFGLVAARSRAMPDDFMESFRAFIDEVEADKTLSPRATMIKLFNGAKPYAPCGDRVIWINIAAVPRYVLAMGILNKLLRRWIPNVQKEAVSLLCSGSEGVFSTDMGRSIFTLSRTAKGIPAVVACMHEHGPDTMLEALQHERVAQPFLYEVNAFLAIHGHRALKEFEIASVRFEEDPAPVLAMIKNYLASDSDPADMQRRASANRAALSESIKGALARLPFERLTGWRWRVINYLAERARYFAKLRENSRFYHIMVWYSARKRILKAEHALLAKGKLKIKDDIFYLRWAEVIALLDNKLTWVDVEDRIRERRMQHIRWSKLTPPKTINIETPAAGQLLAYSEREIKGQGASPGSYEGFARVILDPSVNTDLEPGEILVAPYTDPAWTPLFLTAGAAVVAVGSYLSHAGAIAREYGMPCVVDVPDCTTRIKTGDRLFVNGTHGTVQLMAVQEHAG
jgi:rifampicin phosphotransferase